MAYLRKHRTDRSFSTTDDGVRTRLRAVVFNHTALLVQYLSRPFFQSTVTWTNVVMINPVVLI
jgi:hypothetical protein